MHLGVFPENRGALQLTVGVKPGDYAVVICARFCETLRFAVVHSFIVVLCDI